jgi:hypothetical protein
MNICPGNNCRSCSLRDTPYDKFIAYQLKIDSKKAKTEEENRLALANEVLKRKSINK